MSRLTQLCMMSLGAALMMGAASSFAADEKILSVAAAHMPDSLEIGPNLNTSLQLTMQTNDPLVMRNDAGDVVPGLAERWEEVDDDTWRFYLRRGVKFHDGVEFTAEDIKFTIERVIDPNTVYGFKARIGKATGVTIVDDYTIDINTDGPAPTLPKGLVEILVEPKHYYEQGGHELMIQHPIGTGPFKFDSWVSGDRYELVANEAYWGGAPKVDRVVIRSIPSAATRVASLLAGESHIIDDVPVDLLPEIESNNTVRTDETATTAGLVFIWDTENSPFADPKVRLAADYAVDKEAIFKEILKGRGEVLQGQPLTSRTFGFNADVKARPFDPEMAKKLLEEAGVPAGTPVSLLTRSGSYTSDVEIANVVAGMLSNVGFNATVDVAEGGTFFKRWNTFDIGSALMIGFYSLGDADFALTWYTQNAKRTQWKNAEFEQLYIDARSTTNEEARLKAYHRMMEIMHEENPALFLVGVPAIYGLSSKLSGFEAPSDRLFRLSTAEIAD